MTVEIITICIDALVDEFLGAVRQKHGDEIEARAWASNRKLSPDEMSEFVLEVFDRVNGFTTGEAKPKDLSIRIIPEPHPIRTSRITDIALTLRQ